MGRLLSKECKNGLKIPFIVGNILKTTFYFSKILLMNIKKI